VTNRLMTAEEVAAMLGVPKSWVYSASRRGELPTVTLGRYRRYRAEAVEKWIEEQESGRSMNGLPYTKKE
jgi:excisionase family DNA binding protein